MDMRIFTRGSNVVKLVAAFAAVYLIWGSTYLAIRLAVEGIPPMLMLGARFGVAGLLMYGFLRVRGAQRATPEEWRNAAVVGGLLLFLGTGSVAWAEQYIDSGLAALLVTTVPVWMVVLDWLANGRRPGIPTMVGIGVGFAGVAILVSPGGAGAADAVAGDMRLGAGLVVLFGSFMWSLGSVYSKRAKLPANPFVATAVQMTAGGALLTLAGLMTGELRRFDVAAIELSAVLAWAYLLVFGSFVAFTAYVWLLRNTTPAAVSTYAFVNPAVAVFVGWLFAGEVIDGRMVTAMLMLLAAVAVINVRAAQRAARSAARSAVGVGRKRQQRRDTPLRLDRPAGSIANGVCAACPDEPPTSCNLRIPARHANGSEGPVAPQLGPVRRAAMER